MYYELYIDVLFLENLLLDYLLLSLLRKLLKCPGGWIRRLLAAALGSMGICLLYAFSLEQSLIGHVLVYVVFSTVMVKVGLCIKGRRRLGKALVLLYVCSGLLGGVFQWVHAHLAFPIYPFVGMSLVSFGLLSIGMKWLLRLFGKEQNFYEVRVQFQGRTIPVKALRDTGNRLRDPIFGRPVSIITEDVKQMLCQEKEILFYPVPFHSVGRARGMMQAFFADRLCIKMPEGEEKILERPLLGITKEPLSSQKEYHMILHPELLE